MSRETEDREATGTQAVRAALRAIEPMSEKSRCAMRDRLTATVEAQRVPWFVSANRWIAGGLVVTSMLGGTSYAAASSRPGDALYPLRETVVTTWSKVTGRAQPSAPGMKQDESGDREESSDAPTPSRDTRGAGTGATGTTTTAGTGQTGEEPARVAPSIGHSEPGASTIVQRPDQQDDSERPVADETDDEPTNRTDTRTESGGSSGDEDEATLPDPSDEPDADQDARQVDGDADHNDESSEEEPPLSSDKSDDLEEDER